MCHIIGSPFGLKLRNCCVFHPQLVAADLASAEKKTQSLTSESAFPVA
jgi:hypothetical protein